VNGLIAAMNCKKMAAFTFPVNIGNDDERTIMSVAQYIVDTIGQGIIVSDEPYKIGAMHRKPSLIRAKQILNWSPTVSFEEGIARTIADIKERL
jgi:nucleoside-diphosphate-sugar epimerase